MKGVILAGGLGSRLYPSTISVSKHLLTIYDKPMIYYPLSVLMCAGIKEILIISNAETLLLYKDLLKNGSHLGIEIEYAIQDKPRGIVDAFIIGEKFIGKDNVCLILGDNIFFGHGLVEKLKQATKIKNGAKVFCYYVKDPERYGVVEFCLSSKKVLSIEEKPKIPKSNYAITGLYFCDNTVIRKAKSVLPSNRRELEITSILQMYLDENNLTLDLIGRGTAWLDSGTHDSLLEASNFIATIENRQGLKVACIEEVAYNCGYINKEQLLQLALSMPTSSYSIYVKNIIKY